ncbi:hypothetical protein SAMN05421754_100613 [Nitrosomonas sp. Nm58]|nr:hypothetical protein SAMN05421754_100613 [Nitrosomonas sp. Nm58]
MHLLTIKVFYDVNWINYPSIMQTMAASLLRFEKAVKLTLTHQ